MVQFDSLCYVCLVSLLPTFHERYFNSLISFKPFLLLSQDRIIYLSSGQINYLLRRLLLGTIVIQNDYFRSVH